MKLSYRRETARQLPTWRELGPQPTLPMPPLATPMHIVESETRNKLTSSVPSTKRTLRWIGHSRSFKVILIGAIRNPQQCVVVMCNSRRRYFWSLRRYGNGKTANSSISTTPSQVWRRPSKKRLRISTNGLYCQKPESFTYIFAADSMDLHSLVFT